MSQHQLKARSMPTHFIKSLQHPPDSCCFREEPLWPEFSYPCRSLPGVSRHALNLASVPSQAWKIPDHNIESVDFSGIDSSSKAGAARYWGHKKRDIWWATRIAFCCRSHELNTHEP